MTTSPGTPTDGRSEADLRAELARVEAARAELIRRARDLRAELFEEGPMDPADRAAILTQAEELEVSAAELERRRDALTKLLDTSA